MQIRLTARAHDMKALPLDGLDMFMITRVEGTIHVAELISVVPAEPEEVKRRVRRLLELGVIEAKGPVPPEYTTPKRVIVEQNVSLDGAMTLRPPRQVASALSEDEDEDRATGRPPRKVPKGGIATIRPPKRASVRSTAPNMSVADVLSRAAASVEMRAREPSGARAIIKPSRQRFDTNADRDVPTNPRMAKPR